ncbi:hypothetical protein GCM10009813_26110 [Brevibacterium marinum]
MVRDFVGWRVSDVAATRRVTIIDWADAREAGTTRRTGGPQRRRRDRPWDLIVLTTRPGDLDQDVVDAIAECAPVFLAITSQVADDLRLARSMFPGIEVLIFGPAFLSERVDASEVPVVGRQVRYWAPAGLPRFLIAGRSHAVTRLSRSLGALVLPVPVAMVTMPPAVFIPYAGELSARSGRWTALRLHLRRPTKAAAEAVHALTGVRLPMSASLAGLILDAMERVVPFDVGAYAGRHFGRHEGQTLDMLEAWIARETERSPSGETQRSPGRVAAPTDERLPAAALRDLAQALRPRVTSKPMP